MKRKIYQAAVIVLIVVSIFTFSACGGESAYDIAVKNGFVGTEVEWLDTLKGKSDNKGDSAYDVAVKNGFVGSESEWLASLSISGADIDALYLKYIETYPGNSYSDFLAAISQNVDLTQAAINYAMLSTVSIGATFHKRSGFSTVDYSGTGSGFIIQINEELSEAYIVTNYHVIYDYASTTTGHFAKSIKVSNYAQQKFGSSVPATLVGGALSNDVAVIKVTDPAFFKDSSVKEADIADSNDLVIGSKVHALGDGEGLGLAASSGIVSVDSTIIEMLKLDTVSTAITHRVIRIDAPINPGNSGGGVYDMNGKLIGIVNAGPTDTSIEGMGYALPASLVVPIANSIINGDGKKSVIGISTNKTDTKAEYSNGIIKLIDTVAVVSVTSGSLADRAGLKADDVIVSATLGDGSVSRLSINITRSFYLSDFVINGRAGEILTLNILRNGEAKSVAITLIAEERVAL